jgi:PTS system ascorbate-specific IIA component
MSIALFFVTHEGIASNLLTMGESIIQKTNSNLSFIEVPMDAPIDKILEQSSQKLKQLSTDDGLFFITDIYGSTPSNIARQLAHKYKAHLLSGVNLPMVIRLLNYRDDSAEDLLQKALDGAHQGIHHDTFENAQPKTNRTVNQ